MRLSLPFTQRRERYRRGINRTHSPTLAHAIPWGSVMLGAVLPALFVTSALPLLPPLGFLILLAWRVVRPGVLPLWSGLVLGLIDDLFSGQPLGFAIAFWTLALLAFDWVEMRFPWRGFVQDWLTVAALLFSYCVGGAILSGAPPRLTLVMFVMPQALLSILLFPIIARMVARLDRLRLVPLREVA